MPEMKVVHFEERDVICTSFISYIPHTMEVRNFNDEDTVNGAIYFDGKSYSYNNRGIYDTFLFNNDYSGYEIQTTVGHVSFDTLVRTEGANPLHNIGPKDGVYTWNSGSNTYDFTRSFSGQ